MKKMIYYALAAIVTAGSLLFLTNCSKEDGDGSASKQMGVLDLNTGLRLRSVAGYNFRYDDQGRVQYILGDYRRFEFSYDPNRINIITDGRVDRPTIMNVSYNRSGYISRIESSYDWVDEDSYDRETEDWSFSYDSDGHLVKVDVSVSEREWSEEYGSDNYDGDGTVVLTWSNGLLKTATFTVESTSKAETRRSVEKYEYQYNNDSMLNYPNKYLQYGQFFWIDSRISPLFFLGLFGKGPAFLPSSYSNTYWIEGKEDVEESTYSYGYRLNSDGSLSYVIEYYPSGGSHRDDYTYEHIDVDQGGSSPFTPF